jgi:hypothetical protein
MEKQTRNVLIGIVFVIVAGFLVSGNLGLFATVGNSVTRSVPNTASPGSTITVTYTATGTGTFGVSIVDVVSGGCTFSGGGTEYKTVILSGDDPKTKTLIVPQSGSCILHGDYKFGTDSIVVMPDAVITVVTANTTICSTGQTKCEGTIYYTCSNNAWFSQGEVDGYCGYTETGEETEVPTFELGMVLFKIGNFEVTLLYILIALGGLFIIKLVLGK